jgi:RND superfamily putative drug exporter
MISALTGRRTAWLVALLPLLVAGVLIGLLGEGERDADPTDELPRGADSTYAAELQDALPAADSSLAVVLWTAADGQLSPEQLAAIQEDAGAAGATGPVVPAEDGTAALAVVPVQAATATENADRVGELRDQLREASPEGVKVAVTGPAAVQADLAAVFEGANTRLLLVTAGVVAVLLVVTYRSPILWLVPLVVVAVADRLAVVLSTQLMAVTGVAWNESTIGILSVLVFGAGTDYALLLISRYRDELRVHTSRHEAMAIAVRRTVEPVLSSAITVVCGLLTLLLSLFPTTRGLGLACAVGVLVAATFMLVVLPATLVLFGRWLFWPRVPHVGSTPLVETNSVWRRVGDRVAARPTAFIAGTLLLVVALASGLLGVRTGLDQADQFLDTPEAIAASERLAESFPSGTADPTEVLTRDDAEAVLAAVKGSPGVAGARITQQGAGVTQIDTVLAADPGSPEAEDAVLSLRNELADFPDTHVGGTEATTIDEHEAAQRDRVVIMPLILALVLGALLLLLRCVVAPALLVATVVATFAASLGVSWWVFTGLLGFDALDVGVPLLSFLFLVALGVDYNIFLVTRAREEAAGHGSREGMLRALTATGGVITSAGVLLAAVFAVLGVLPLVVLAQLGTIICIGVLLDTFVVRTVLVPALALRLGDRFWWPRRL